MPQQLHLHSCAWIVALLCLPLSARGEEWTEFRGPTGQGLSSAAKLPTTWSGTEHVAWNRAVPGLGWSSPVVYQGRLYVTTAVPLQGREGRSLRTLCFDSKSGKPVWDAEVFEETDAESLRIHTKNSHASSTPIIDGRRLFVHFGNSGTACLTHDGEIVWTSRELKYDHKHGNGGSPVLVEGLVVINCDGADVAYVAALDQGTGKVRWKQPRPENSDKRTFAFSTPLVIDVAGARQIVSAGAGAVVGDRPKDGAALWRVHYPGGYSVVPRPVFGHGLVYLSSGYDVAEILAIRPDGSGDVTSTHVAWRVKSAAPRNASPLLVGNELYTVSDAGVAQCIDAKTGAVHWRTRLGGNFSASPVAAAGNVYFLSEEGDTTVVKTGRTLREVSRNPLGGERTFASFAVDGNSLILRTERRLLRIE